MQKQQLVADNVTVSVSNPSVLKEDQAIRDVSHNASECNETLRLLCIISIISAAVHML